MNEYKGSEMNDRPLVALSTQDSYFNDWLIDLYSLERCSSEQYSEKMWSGVAPTYTSILVRPN
jgi:hypothetical protein